MRGLFCYGTMLLLALGQTLASEDSPSTPVGAESAIEGGYRFVQTIESPVVLNAFGSNFDFEGYEVFRIFVETLHEDDFIHRVYGDGTNPASLSAPGGLYNSNFCLGSTSGQVPPVGNFSSNDFAFDSWVGIGLTSFPDPDEGEFDVTLTGADLSWANNFNVAFMPSGNYGPVDFAFEDAPTAGGWELENIDAVNGFAGEDLQAIVLQLTSPSTIVWTLNAEIYVHGDPNNVVLISQTFDGTSMGPAIVEGCTDSGACNYYEYATSDNGTCTFSLENYDCNDDCLNDQDLDGVCDEIEVVGCQDESACNYNSSATDEGECFILVGNCDYCSGATDGTGTVVDNDADNDSTCDGDEVLGCQDASACNYNSLATDAGDCEFVDGICETCSGATDGSGTVVDNDSDDDNVCDADEVAGCQDATACNYNASATDAGVACIFVDGICETCSGATDGSGTVVDNDSDDDNVCDADEVAGCQDASACNYNASATDGGVTCIFVDGICETCSGATDGTGTTVDNDSDNDDVCDADEIAGCQNETACNYNASATDGGVTCLFVDGICETCSGATNGTGTVIDNDSDNDNVCDADEVIGCQDNTACNYDASATDGGVTCIFVDGICETCSGASDGTGTVVDNDSDNDLVCDADEIAGCQDASACNYNASATDGGVPCTFVDGICETCSGATDGTGTVIDNDSDNDNVCNADEVVGCQDADACNFMSVATDGGTDCIYASEACEVCSGSSVDGTGFVEVLDADDDGVCDSDEVVGCQNTQACNYMISATDAGVCVYATGCETCSGQNDGTGTIVLNDDDGDSICNEDEIVGCYAPTACNYNVFATDSGACVFASGCESCSGEADGTGTIVDNDDDNDGICDADEIVGCQISTACNYMGAATDPGECIIAGPFYNCSGDCLNDADDNGICDEIDTLLDNAESEGYDDGFVAGEATCLGEAFCGEGTVWSDDFQLCIEDSSCPGDLNGDLVVGTGDLLLLLSDYGFFCNE